MSKIYTGLFSIFLFAIWVLAGIMHVWTIYISFKSSGIFWAIVTTFFPLISEIFWGYQSYKYFGYESPYIQWLIVLAALWLIYWVVGILASFLSKD